MKTLSPLTRRMLTYTVSIAILFGIYVALILLSDQLSSNIIYAHTMLGELTEWGYLAAELLVLILTYACLLYTLFTHGHWGALRIVAVYVAVTLIRHVAMLWLGYSELWAETVNLLPELAQLGAVYVACASCVQAFDRQYAVMQQGALTLGRPCAEREALVYPCVKQPIKADPIKRAAAASATILIAVRVFSRLIFDFNYGAPADLIDGLWMLLYYSVDVLIGVGAYCLMLGIVRILAKQQRLFEKILKST